MPFSDFALDPALLKAVDDLGFVDPTDIQRDAIPPALEGRDVLGAAMTGSGKTAAFVLPILNGLLAKPRGTTRALVLTPTRELAAQVSQHLGALAAHTEIGSAVIHGGVAYEPQERAFRTGVDVLIATPGRLLDHLRRSYANLDGLEYLVLDEADRMLDMGFIPDVRRILAQVPAERQTMLFSATMPGPIVSLSAEVLRNPATINIERKAAPATGITQVVYMVRHELKPALLLHLLRHGDIESCLAFTRTKERADLLANYLQTNGVSVEVIHGDRTQAHRTRALEAFKSGEHQVLVATDVAARGLDMVDLTHVVNVDVPSQPEDYIHRVGRTARHVATGDAITFVAARELADLHSIERAIGGKLPRMVAEGFEIGAPRPEPAAVAVVEGVEETGWVARTEAERRKSRVERKAPESGTRRAGRTAGDGEAGGAGRERGEPVTEPSRMPDAPAVAAVDETEPVRTEPVAAGSPRTGASAPEAAVERFARLRAVRGERRPPAVPAPAERPTTLPADPDDRAGDRRRPSRGTTRPDADHPPGLRPARAGEPEPAAPQRAGGRQQRNADHRRPGTERPPGAGRPADESGEPEPAAARSAGGRQERGGEGVDRAVERFSRLVARRGRGRRRG